LGDIGKAPGGVDLLGLDEWKTTKTQNQPESGQHCSRC